VLRHRIAAGSIAAALFAIPLGAHAADHLDCMAQGYDAEQEKVIESFVGSFDTKSLKSEPSGALMGALSARAGACADQHGWSPNAILNAVFHQTGAMMEAGLRRHSPLSDADMVRLLRAINRADQQRLWPILENMMGPFMSGEEAEEPSKDDNLYLGLVILSSGIPDNDTSTKFAGALLAAQAIQRLAAKRFASE